jgi:predicted unusual protein kinase regulating ubiquinone biosynthesis (AarF/ABC1/UbiB family)
MVGRVPDHLRAGIREAAIGIGTRDPERLTHSYQMLGILLPGADLSLLREAETRVFDRNFGAKICLSFARSATGRWVNCLRIPRTDLQHAVPDPQDFILLVRAIGILSGICTGLDPKFNVWENIAPYAQKLIKEDAVGAEPAWLEILRSYLEILVRLPGRLDRVLDTVESGQLVIQGISNSPGK